MGNRNSGRRPKPTALKVLQGNPGKRPLNQAEPKPPAGPVVKPALSLGADKVWDEIAPVCEAMGTLTSADVKPFASLCELQATFTANALLKDHAPTHFSVLVELKTAATLRPYYEKFGLEPVGRARISVPKAEEPVSKWA